MTVRIICSRLALLALLSIVGFGAALEAQAVVPANPTGHFGRLAYHKESGDVVGLEVFIMKGRSGYVAVVQIAEGVPEDPVVVPVTIANAVISFQLGSGKERLRYLGAIQSDGLYGKFDNGAFSERDDGLFLLRRGLSYWER